MTSRPAGLYVTDDPEGFVRGKFDEELEVDGTNLLGAGDVEDKLERDYKVEAIVQQPSEGSWKTVDSEGGSDLMSSDLTQSPDLNLLAAEEDYATMSDVESQVIKDDTDEESGQEMITRRSLLIMADYAYLNADDTDSEPSSAEIERIRRLETIKEEEEEEEEEKEKVYLSDEGGDKAMGGKEQQG